MKFNHLAAAALVALSGTTMAATTFTKTAFHFGNTAEVTYLGNTSTVRTAEIIGNNTAPAGSFAAWCIEVDAAFASPFTGNTGALSQAQADNLSTLFTAAGWKSWDWANDSVANGDTAKITALQLATWEIIYDSVGGLDLQDGNFKISAGDYAAYGATIAGWMSVVNTSMSSDILGISDGLQGRENRQDIVIATAPPIPEPSTYALMFAGLAAVGAVVRRRQRAR